MGMLLGSDARPRIGPGLAVLTACAAIGLAGCSGSPAAAPVSPSASSAASAPSASSAPAKHAARPHVTGQITAMNGSTWTVHGTDGQTYTVTLTDQTRFGTTKHPATRGQFTVGSPVRIRGTVSGTTVAATRITSPRDAA
jgi:hypothetical protein